nr:hypothetical protein K-LCC10_0410 [Kaumoebavirus]
MPSPVKSRTISSNSIPYLIKAFSECFEALEISATIIGDDNLTPADNFSIEILKKAIKTNVPGSVTKNDVTVTVGLIGLFQFNEIIPTNALPIFATTYSDQDGYYGHVFYITDDGYGKAIITGQYIIANNHVDL